MAIERRKQDIREISEFSKLARTELCTLLGELNWTVESLKGKDYVICPLDSNHTVPQQSLVEHIEYCSWIKDGYSKEEKEMALPNSHFNYKNSTTVVPVLIDAALQHQILSDAVKNQQLGVFQDYLTVPKKVPRTMDHCVTELSPRERLAIYDYVVTKAKATNKPAGIQVEDLQFNFENQDTTKEEKPKTALEILAEQRDYKRRRPSYRAKNVHITKKSYTEVMREVIENQTRYLTSIHNQEHCKSGMSRNEVSDSSQSSIEEMKNDARNSDRHSLVDRRESKSHHSKHKRKTHKDKDRKRSREHPRE